MIVACGALVSELRAVLGQVAASGGVEMRFLPANLHNRPEGIVPALREHLDAAREQGREVFVGYADCGTGGALDRLLEGHPGVRRLPGAHCYEFFAGADEFARLHDEEPGTFYLTDFLAKHFRPLVWEGLGLDRHPQLRDDYFGAYRRVVLLSQAGDDAVLAAAAEAAAMLGLPLEHRHTGLGHFADAIPVTVRMAGAA
jgi:hypothetical protein